LNGIRTRERKDHPMLPATNTPAEMLIDT